MIMVVVYVGAVAVLFMFVVMMLDVNVAELRQGFLQYLPLGGVVGLILLLELAMVVGGFIISPEVSNRFSAPIPINTQIPNTEALGSILYTKYIYFFQASGMILLVAMIGAIVLTFKKRTGIKRQSYIEQISREKSSSVSLVDKDINTGVKIDD